MVIQFWIGFQSKICLEKFATEGNPPCNFSQNLKSKIPSPQSPIPNPQSPIPK
ncbi:dihydropteroate synthase [Tolypothrix sp. PCC 7601]|nr:dihydropteroate synthase [Tolypothrix sp. PCC 7601]